jgi:hypothetical protein
MGEQEEEEQKTKTKQKKKRPGNYGVHVFRSSI